MIPAKSADTTTFSLAGRAWRGFFTCGLVLGLVTVVFGGIEVYLDSGTVGWFGWFRMLFGAFWVVHVLYLRRRGYLRSDNRLVLAPEGVEFLAAEMAAPKWIPLASLKLVRTAAGNLYFELTDEEPIRLVIGWLPYRRVQRIKAALREWGKQTGVEVLA